MKTKSKHHPMLMEYVVIAVIIAVAIAVGLWFFGREISSEFGNASSATCGNNCGAGIESARQSAVQCHSDAESVSRSNKFFMSGEDRDENEGGRCANPRASVVDPVPLPDDGGPTPSDAFAK